nr:unnamed protein product [Digitaria exilis]
MSRRRLQQSNAGSTVWISPRQGPSRSSAWGRGGAGSRPGVGRKKEVGRPSGSSSSGPSGSPSSGRGRGSGGRRRSGGRRGRRRQVERPGVGMKKSTLPRITRVSKKHPPRSLLRCSTNGPVGFNRGRRKRSEKQPVWLLTQIKSDRSSP